MRSGGALERAAGPLVQLGPAGQEEILVHHLVHERVREPVAAWPSRPCPTCWIRSASTRRSSSDIGAARVGSQCSSSSASSNATPAPPPPGAAPAARREAGRRGRAAARAASAERSTASQCRRARPAIALAHEHAACSPGCGRSPRRTADCPRRASRRNPGRWAKASPSTGPNRLADQRPRSRPARAGRAG